MSVIWDRPRRCLLFGTDPINSFILDFKPVYPGAFTDTGDDPGDEPVHSLIGLPLLDEDSRDFLFDLFSKFFVSKL